jgi:hypothetical protein
MLCGRPGSSHLGVWRLSRALMVSVTPHRSLHKFTLVRDYLSCTIEYPHLASGLATLIPPPTRTGLPLTRRMPGSSRKTGAHQAQVSLFRPKAELWKKSGRRSEQAGYRPRAHTMLAPRQIFADSHSRQTEGPPQESPGAGAGGPQFARQIPPMVPKHEAVSLPVGSNFVLSGLTKAFNLTLGLIWGQDHSIPLSEPTAKRWIRQVHQ